MNTLTVARLRELFDCDPERGVLTRKLYRPDRPTGTKHHSGYARVTVDGKSHAVHRLIWLWAYGEMPDGELDHINGRRDDNRLSNLRPLTRVQNQQNQRRPRADNKSGYLGVALVANSKKNPYRAFIRFGGKQRCLGGFPTAEAAYGAYLSAKRQYHEGCTI